MSDCERCGKPHQRLILIYDSYQHKINLECLDCLSELLVGRLWDKRLINVDNSGDLTTE